MLFVTFEGVECSGKTLQSKKSLEYCNQKNIPAILVREPGTTEVGEQLRKILLTQYCTPLTEFFILSASRAQLTETIIQPKLKEGIIVICDRYFHSSLVYQGYGRNLNILDLQEISKKATLELQPSKTFLLKPSFQTTTRRLQEKITSGLDRIELENTDFHQRIYDGYLELSSQYNYISIIDGDLNPDTIHKQILIELQQTDTRFL